MSKKSSVIDRILCLIGVLLIAGTAFAGGLQLGSRNAEQDAAIQTDALIRGYEDQIAALKDNLTHQIAVSNGLLQIIDTEMETYYPCISRIKIGDVINEGGNISAPGGDCYVTTVCATGSMLPWIYKGVTIVLQRTQEVGVGDVAVYERNGQSIIHRVIGEEDGLWIFKGDNNPGVERVEKDKVTARLIAVFY